MTGEALRVRMALAGIDDCGSSGEGEDDSVRSSTSLSASESAVSDGRI